MKQNTTILFILCIGIISLFATCKQNTTSDTVADKVDIPTDTTETEPLDTDTMRAIESSASLSLKPKNEEQYKFIRNPNNYPQNYFRSPFDSAIYVSGTFCELRGNHFHGGLDIRTGGREGWKVLAVADGYVERVKVSTKGYGRVVYIKHPNGKSSVYGHLQGFVGPLADYVKKAQYDSRSFEIELYPKAGQIKLSKGQFFALSGNTGGSGGPHLHFEIRTSGGISTNPLMHGLNVKDKLPPVIKKVSIYNKDPESLCTRGNYPYKTVTKASPYLRNTQTLDVSPGKYSFGLNTDDYFTDRKNVLGINYCWVTANGALLYEYQIEKFNFSQGRYIYTHTDPYLKWKDNKTYIRLFKEKYNPLGYYKQKQNAEVSLAHGDSVEIKIHIQDYAGLQDSVSWIMVGDTTAKPFPRVAQVKQEKTLRVSGAKHIKFNEWSISIPKKAVYHPFDFKLATVTKREKMLSKTLQMHYGYTPLHTYINVSYRVPAQWLSYGDKLCAVSFDGSKTYYEGGTLNGTTLSFRTRSLGQYAITYDTEAPKLNKLKLGKTFKFRATDNLSGIKSIKCTVDDKWILAEYEPKTNTIWGKIPSWIESGTYTYKLTVTDSKGNSTTFKESVRL